MARTKNDPRNHKYRKLEVLINGSMTAEKRSLSDMARILDMHENSARKYLRDPSLLTVDMIGRLGRNLHIPIEDMRECIKY